MKTNTQQVTARTSEGERPHKEEGGQPIMASKFEEMTTEEKQEVFNRWVQNRESRKVKTQGKRKALQALVKAHQDEYNALVKKFGKAA